MNQPFLKKQIRLFQNLIFIKVVIPTIKKLNIEIFTVYMGSIAQKGPTRHWFREQLNQMEILNVHFNFLDHFFLVLKSILLFGVEIHLLIGLISINKFLFFYKKQWVESILLELMFQDFMAILKQKIKNGITA